MNIWETLNDRIPDFFGNFQNDFGISFIKITDISTAMIGSGFAIIIKIDRFYIDVIYVMKNNNVIEAYQCGSFFAEKYDENDRKKVIVGQGAEVFIINELNVLSDGLYSKWKNVLYGDKKWIEEYKISKWFSRVRLSENERRRLYNLI